MVASLQEVAALGRPLFALFSHPAPRVAHAAALLMRAVAEGGAEAAQPMREAALAEGAILQHLLRAVSQPRPGSSQQALSRDLVAVWADEYAPALALLKRVFPPGLIRQLNQRRQPALQPAQHAPPAAAPVGLPAAPVAQQQQVQQQQQGGDPGSMLASTQQLVAAASAVPGAAAAAPGSGDPLQAQPQAVQAGAQPPRASDSPVRQRFATPAPPPERTGEH